MFLLHLKNVLAFGTANLGSPIGNTFIIQMKFCRTFGTTDDHKLKDEFRSQNTEFRMRIRFLFWILAPGF